MLAKRPSIVSVLTALGFGAAAFTAFMVSQSFMHHDDVSKLLLGQLVDLPQNPYTAEQTAAGVVIKAKEANKLSITGNQAFDVFGSVLQEDETTRFWAFSFADRRFALSKAIRDSHPLFRRLSTFSQFIPGPEPGNTYLVWSAEDDLIFQTGRGLENIYRCGNGVLEGEQVYDHLEHQGQPINHPAEVCDDGNTRDGDTCSFDCSERLHGAGGSSSASAENVSAASAQSSQENVSRASSASSQIVASTASAQSENASANSQSGTDDPCGNGVLDSGEQCDDDNTNDDDGCSSACVIEDGYECSEEPSSCNLICSNGRLDQGESCDDGNTITNDGCHNCAVQERWECDQSEPSVCTRMCGNGRLDDSEQCDDGGIVKGDGCSEFCRQEPDWVCNGEPSTCVQHTVLRPIADISRAPQGRSDTFVERVSWQARWGSNTYYKAINDSVHRPDKSTYVYPPLEKSRLHPQSFSVRLRDVTSADTAKRRAVIRIGTTRFNRDTGTYTPFTLPLTLSEPFDTSSRVSVMTSVMHDSGRFPKPIWFAFTVKKDHKIIGYRKISGDDLTTINTRIIALDLLLLDGDPQPECGDGTVDAGEQCDDGNLIHNDGCSLECIVERGYVCTGEPSVCTHNCGNGVIDAGETCDDGNRNSRDGCHSNCGIDRGWTCSGEPSVCVSLCGNGRLDDRETCDDNNANPGDGCSAGCRTESGYSCTGQPSTCTRVEQTPPPCGDGQCNWQTQREHSGNCTKDCTDPTYEVPGRSGVRGDSLFITISGYRVTANGDRNPSTGAQTYFFYKPAGRHVFTPKWRKPSVNLPYNVTAPSSANRLKTTTTLVNAGTNDEHLNVDVEILGHQGKTFSHEREQVSIITSQHSGFFKEKLSHESKFSFTIWQNDGPFRSRYIRPFGPTQPCPYMIFLHAPPLNRQGDIGSVRSLKEICIP